MRRLVLWFVLAFAGLATPAHAQQPAQPAMQAPAPEATPAAPSAPQAPLTENPDAKPLEWRGPSGFWTNPHPAKGGAYRWRMMAVGGGLLLITGFMMLRLVKKASAERRR
jgi:hypothetical protein